MHFHPENIRMTALCLPIASSMPRRTLPGFSPNPLRVLSGFQGKPGCFRPGSGENRPDSGQAKASHQGGKEEAMAGRKTKGQPTCKRAFYNIGPILRMCIYEIFFNTTIPLGVFFGIRDLVFLYSNCFYAKTIVHPLWRGVEENKPGGGGFFLYQGKLHPYRTGRQNLL